MIATVRFTQKSRRPGDQPGRRWRRKKKGSEKIAPLAASQQRVQVSSHRHYSARCLAVLARQSQHTLVKLPRVMCSLSCDMAKLSANTTRYAKDRPSMRSTRQFF
jgi:hypothetical protein